MDIAKYPIQKAAGNVELKKYGDTCQCLIRQFSLDTGKEIAPITATLDRKHLAEERKILAERLTAMDALLTDFDALVNAP